MEEGGNKKIEVYTSPGCHFCQQLKTFLSENNISFTEYDVSTDESKREELVQRSQQLGVPVVFIDNTDMIIGFDENILKEKLGL